MTHFNLSQRSPSLRSALDLSGRIALLLGVYLVLEWWVESVGRLPEESYRQPWLFLEFVRCPWAIFLFLVVVVSFLLGPERTLWQTWASLENGKAIRSFVFFVVLVLSWSFSAYPTNWYFGQPHGSDRLLLLALSALVWWRPVFLFPYVLVLAGIRWQFSYPLEAGYLMPEFKPLINVLILFCSTQLLAVVTRRRNTSDFVFLSCCLVASNFWVPGLGKLVLNWITHGHTYFIVHNAHANGWLSWLDPMTRLSIAKMLAQLDWPILMFTLLLECGALLFLWRRSVALVFLVGWTFLLLGIFSSIGYFFWKWLCLHVALFWLLLRGGRNRFVSIFSIPHVMLSILLIGGSMFWFKPATLAWYDTPLCYIYRFEGIGLSGATYHLSPRFFAPYRGNFMMAPFGYLVDSPLLVSPYGVTKDRSVAEALLQLDSADDIATLETDLGRNRFHPKKTARFDKFIREFVGHKNAQEIRFAWWDALRPPPFLWGHGRSNASVGEDPIQRVIVYQQTWFYDGKRPLKWRDKRIREIDIPPMPESAHP